MSADDLPAEIAINAWTGSQEATAALDARAPLWGTLGLLPRSQQVLDLGEPADQRDWCSPAVGYGILLAESDAAPADKALALDAEPPVRDLLQARPGTVMLRWDPNLPPGTVRRYFPDGSSQPPDRLSGFGTGLGQIPRYVLIIGGPESVPWPVQYELSNRRAVGRLPLTGDALDHYITALINDFKDSEIDVQAPLMWTVDLGDITAQMRAVIAGPLAARLTDKRLPRFTHLVDDQATGAGLLAALAAQQPALVVTSSHGVAEGSGEQLRAVLGQPVDDARQMIDVDAVDAAMPGGAIWHSQACCSAGSEGPSKYAGLLNQGTTALAVINEVASLGSTVAPAALRLLGRKNPVRAVIGHVEPTFDLTLRVADTGQGLGGDIVNALSTNLFLARQPLGLAFADYRAGVGELYAQYATALRQRNQTGDDAVLPRLTRLQLTAMDRQSMVILGDPTVTLPPLPDR